jgi:glyoxylase-like metal-dependent hydrolase (beta-lactamase superfamily II)
MEIHHFFDARTSTLTYVVHDRDARVAVVIDPVLDFDPASGRIFTEFLDTVSRFLEAQRLSVPFVLDTHAHADHLSAMAQVRERHGSRSAIGARIIAVQRVFREIFHLGDELPVDGSQFDVLLEDGGTLDLGAFALRAIHTPGHTPACMSYHVGEALFVGDTLFQPDYGTARCDFPGGSAETLHASILRLYRTLPGETRVFTCHDYQPGGRPVAFESTLLEQRLGNVQLREDTSLDEFVAFRLERDAGLAMPALILPSIQVNIRAGRLPAPEANGLSYLKIPINAFGTGV